MGKLIVQFVGADPYEDQPTGRLKLSEEYQSMKRVVQASRAQQHDLFDAPAARLLDVVNELQRNRPNCVHFTCHGTQFSRIVLLGDFNQPEPISHVTVARLFNALSGRIRLVTLSCCYSAEQASRIAEIIECVIGIEGAVGVTAAAAYSIALYGALANGESVAEGHRLALIQFAHHNPKGHAEPKMYLREGVDAETLFPGKPSETRPRSAAARRRTNEYRQAKTAFEDNCRRYGVWADELIVRKSALLDGSCAVSYRIDNLCAMSDQIRRIYFDFKTTAGLVSKPDIDLGPVDWKPVPCREPESLRGLFEQLTSVRGHFDCSLEFKSKGAEKRNTYDLAWTIPVLNADAVTTWEYHNLYAHNQQRHVDGSQLPELPEEYFSVLTWFPVKKLTIHLSLPQPAKIYPNLTFVQPRSRMFRCRGSALSIRNVMDRETLYMRPFPKNGRKVRWESMLNNSGSLEPILENRPDGTSTLTLEFPPVGGYASLDWDMVELQTTDRLDHLIRETEHLRDELLRHRSDRVKGKKMSHMKVIRSIFAELHDRLWQRFDRKNPTTKFESTLLVWDQSTNRMQVADGFINGCELSSTSKAWKFWLPFGFGLSGKCFRTAEAQAYRRPLEPFRITGRQNYLLLPKSLPHECILALPIDHPEFLQADLDSLGPFRSRQLVGVMTIGSTFKASELCKLCGGGEPSQIQQHMQDLQMLREDCQAACDKIALEFFPRIAQIG
jgi:CHAT domain